MIAIALRWVHFRKRQYKCVCYVNAMFKGKVSIVIALRWVEKPLRWTEKTISFKMMPS